MINVGTHEMSEASKAAREAMKKKAHRLADGDDYKGEKIDASGYKVPGEMHTEEKTGEKPKNPRMFKRGGKVEGAEATHHAGKKPRAKRDLGGAAPTAAGAGTAGPMLNLPAAAQAQVANAARTPNPQGMLGSHPVQSWMAKAGGIKKGGRVKKAEGGNVPIPEPNSVEAKIAARNEKEAGQRVWAKKLMQDGNINPVTGAVGKSKGGEAYSDAKEDRRLIDKMVKPEARTGKKEGGKAHKAKGGEVVGNSEVTGTRPTGGRLARKHGGSAGKGKMNVNIIIAQKPDGAMGAGAPMMPPGAPPHPIPPPVIPPASMGGGAAGGMPSAMPSGMPAGMPPMRAAGGRLFPKPNAGGGGGEGRLEKIKEYGNKFAKEKNKGG
jgi:hypothetical protein